MALICDGCGDTLVEPDDDEGEEVSHDKVEINGGNFTLCIDCSNVARDYIGTPEFKKKVEEKREELEV